MGGSQQKCARVKNIDKHFRTWISTKKKTIQRNRENNNTSQNKTTRETKEPKPKVNNTTKENATQIHKENDTKQKTKKQLTKTRRQQRRKNTARKEKKTTTQMQKRSNFTGQKMNDENTFTSIYKNNQKQTKIRIKQKERDLHFIVPDLVRPPDKI